MKKLVLLTVCAASALITSAQVTLSGSSYTQNFDDLNLPTPAIPSGWFGYTDATSTSPGVSITIQKQKNYGVFADTVESSSCKANVWDDNFKNYPSANAVSKAATCTEQQAITDRALGVRQKSNPVPPTTPLWDPGAAFVLKLANTAGRADFNMTFKLQSLDTTSPRTTTWTVDYGFGASPTSFTPATTTGTMTTGGLSFTNNTINVDFGSGLDNQSDVVWIRIVALTASTGSGNRASTAIDDVNLTWTNTAGVSNTANVQSLSLTPVATSTERAVFACATSEAGKYNMAIYDVTGRVVYNNTINVNSTRETLTVDGLNLTNGFYFARMSNGNSNAVAKFTVK